MGGFRESANSLYRRDMLHMRVRTVITLYFAVYGATLFIAMDVFGAEIQRHHWTSFHAANVLLGIEQP